MTQMVVAGIVLSAFVAGAGVLLGVQGHPYGWPMVVLGLIGVAFDVGCWLLVRGPRP